MDSYDTYYSGGHRHSWIDYEQAVGRSIALKQGPLVADVGYTVQKYIIFSPTRPTPPSVTALHCPPGFKHFLS